MRSVHLILSRYHCLPIHHTYISVLCTHTCRSDWRSAQCCYWCNRFHSTLQKVWWKARPAGSSKAEATVSPCHPQLGQEKWLPVGGSLHGQVHAKQVLLWCSHWELTETHLPWGWQRCSYYYRWYYMWLVGCSNVLYKHWDSIIYVGEVVLLYITLHV